MRMLVCGGREFSDKDQLYRVLDFYKPTFIISGAARGADTLAIEYAKDRKIPYKEYPADWKRYGNHAGHIRNKEMIILGLPDVVIAFTGGHGTENMIKQSKSHKIKIIIVPTT